MVFRILPQSLNEIRADPIDIAVGRIKEAAPVRGEGGGDAALGPEDLAEVDGPAPGSVFVAKTDEKMAKGLWS